MDMKTMIPESDIRAAFDAAVNILAESSPHHAAEMGGYIRRAFRVNPQLVPVGVLMMYNMGASEFERLVRGAYPAVMAGLVLNMIEEELRKLPGVDAIFKQFQEEMAASQ